MNSAISVTYFFQPLTPYLLLFIPHVLWIIQNIWFLAFSCKSLKGSFPMVRRLPSWPKGGTHSSGWRALFEPFDKTLRTGSASWSALLGLAFVPSHEARRGVTGFGPYCRNKRPVLSHAEGASPAGAKPGNAEHHVHTRVGDTRRYLHLPTLFY